MSNWSDLKSAVASIIKTNGAQQITGQLLQNVLNNIISNVGLNSTFAGIATPETNPGTPDGNVFYLATTEGTYSNFNGIVINSGEAVILEWKGSWVKKDSGFATKEKLSELENAIFGTVFKYNIQEGESVNSVTPFKAIPANDGKIVVKIIGVKDEEVVFLASTNEFSSGINLRKTIKVGTFNEIELPSNSSFCGFTANRTTDEAIKIKLYLFTDSKLVEYINEKAVENKEYSDKAIKLSLDKTALTFNFAGSGNDVVAKFMALPELDRSKPLMINVVDNNNTYTDKLVIYYSTTEYSDGIIDEATQYIDWGVDTIASIPTEAKYIALYSGTLVENDRNVNFKMFYSNFTAKYIVNKQGNNLEILTRLDGNYNIKYTLSPMSPNNIVQFNKVDLYRQYSGMFDGVQTRKATNTFESYSDIIGPYYCEAAKNADGDNQTQSFTGGTHGYNGDATGSATAQMTSINVLVNGTALSEDGQYEANDVIVSITNEIQGWNTKKSDGSGRNILQEKTIYKFSDCKIFIRNDIKAIEAAKITKYYGLQNGFLRDSFELASDEPFTEHNFTDSGSFFSNSISELRSYKEPLILISELSHKGLGSFIYSSDKQAFKSGNKLYYSLIGDKSLDLDAGSSVFWEGNMRFLSTPPAL